MTKGDCIKCGKYFESRLRTIICSSCSFNLDKTKCLICQQPEIDFYNIAKEFCSDFKAIRKNICVTHYPKFVVMGTGFLND